MIFVNLGDSDTKDCDGIIRMLYTLLVSEHTAQEKKDIIHQEYDVPMDVELDEEVDKMCNISSMYIERGVEKGTKIGMEKGIEKGKLVMLCQLVDNNVITIEQAAAQLHISVHEFKKLKESITY